MKKISLEIGTKVNKLTVIGYTEPDWLNKKRRKAICKCECGNITNVTVCKIKSGHTKSCGCIKEITKYTAAKTHGLSSHPLYDVYCGIKQRCYNPYYKNLSYQKKGVTMCEEWKSNFLNFYNWAINNGWEKGLHLDRIDSNDNYCPENCQFLDSITNYSKVYKDFKKKLEYEKRIEYLEKLLLENNIPF
jgi:hypothetical protein